MRAIGQVAPQAERCDWLRERQGRMKRSVKEEMLEATRRAWGAFCA
jgi:hypothetical protein